MLTYTILTFLSIGLITQRLVIMRNAKRAKEADLRLAREIMELKTSLIDEREKLRIQRRLDQRGKPERDKATLDLMAFELKIKEEWKK